MNVCRLTNRYTNSTVNLHLFWRLNAPQPPGQLANHDQSAWMLAAAAAAAVAAAAVALSVPPEAYKQFQQVFPAPSLPQSYATCLRKLLQLSQVVLSHTFLPGCA